MNGILPPPRSAVPVLGIALLVGALGLAGAALPAGSAQAAGCTADPASASWAVHHADGAYRLASITWSGFSDGCLGSSLAFVVRSGSTVLGEAEAVYRGGALRVNLRSFAIPAASVDGVALVVESARPAPGGTGSPGDSGAVLDVELEPDPELQPDPTAPTQPEEPQRCECEHCAATGTTPYLAGLAGLGALLLLSWIWFAIVLRRRRPASPVVEEVLA